MTTIANPPGAEGAPGPDPGEAAPNAGSGPEAGWRVPPGSDAEMAARLRLADHPPVAPAPPAGRRRGDLVAGVGAGHRRTPRHPHPGELASSEQVQPPSMTKMVVGLEAAGLVARQEDDPTAASCG
jgi:hypothetical protein